MNFHSLGLSLPILEAVAARGYDLPTPIQAQVIPAIIAGKDVMGRAQTGTGKTAGFTLPILHRLAKGSRPRANHVRALILVPTRELAAQVYDSATTYGSHLSLSATVVYGGVKINPQMMKLRRGIDILVATPGRLLDLYARNAVKFDQLEVLVLDEADRMLDLGFLPEIREVLALLPRHRQSLMFSATFSDQIRTLAKGIMTRPVEISVGPGNTTAKSIEQWVHPVDKKKKSALLAHLIKQNQWSQVLIFAGTRQGANKLVRYLETAGIKALAIHGDKSQAVRTRTMVEFKQGKIPVLVATDIAARGLDVDQLPCVINFDLPAVAENYVHRIGRTGRAGSAGKAISLLSADEVDHLSAIEHLLKKLLHREFIDGFEPLHNVPETRLDPRKLQPKKPKKPKKPKDRGQTAVGANSQLKRQPGGRSRTKKPGLNSRKKQHQN